MRLDEELAQFATGVDSVITIGVFDGVHRGHQHLIDQLVRNARKSAGRLAGVVTFREHPGAVLRPDFEPSYITTLEERLDLLKQLGADFVIPITFDEELAKLRVRPFIQSLQKHLNMRGMVVGPDFAMGHNREGDVKALPVLGRELGFTVEVIDLLLREGKAVRSTAIRQSLAQGDVVHAAELLGRSYAHTGRVVRGEQRGKTLGFPTANLDVAPGMAVPGNGIYATVAHVGEDAHMAATSIGTRPTFDGVDRTVEAFLLDFDGDLYDRKVRLEFVQRLRDELKFDSVDALIVQMRKDVEQTRAILEPSRRSAAETT